MRRSGDAPIARSKPQALSRGFSSFNRLRRHFDGGFAALPMPKVAVRPLQHASCCFPHAYPVSRTRAGSKKRPRMTILNQIIDLLESNWGERRHSNPDPNLGKLGRSGVYALAGPSEAERRICQFLRRKDAEEWALEVERRIDRGELAFARMSISRSSSAHSFRLKTVEADASTRRSWPSKCQRRRPY